jgi:hypothetical protein
MKKERYKKSILEELDKWDWRLSQLMVARDILLYPEEFGVALDRSEQQVKDEVDEINREIEFMLEARKKAIGIRLN